MFAKFLPATPVIIIKLESIDSVRTRWPWGRDYG